MKTVVRFLGTGFLVFWGLSGCAARRMVAVGLSAEMEICYGIYPSIEPDIVAVTAGEELL